MNCPTCPPDTPADFHVIHGVDGVTRAECDLCGTVWDPSEDTEGHDAR